MSARTESEIAEAMHAVFVSPNVSDSNFESANLVDVMDNHGRQMLDAATKIANGLGSIALAIENLADAIRERSS